MTRRLIPHTLATAWLVIVSSAAIVGAGINPQPFRTGLFGVTAGQSIRISVLNAGDAGGIINPWVRVFDLAGMLLFETDSGALPGGVGIVDFADRRAPASGRNCAPRWSSCRRCSLTIAPPIHSILLASS